MKKSPLENQRKAIREGVARERARRAVRQEAKAAEAAAIEAKLSQTASEGGA